MREGLTGDEPGPPRIAGVARLAALAFQGWSLDHLCDEIGPAPDDRADYAAWLLDYSFAHALSFEAERAATLQAEALGLTQVFRVGPGAGGVRLLAVMAPGNLMVNAPLDFLTQTTGVSLSLAFTTADGTLPANLPEHDIAIVAVSESAPRVLAALPAQLAAWPVPVLNDPAHIGRLSRDWLAGALAGVPGVYSFATLQASRSELSRFSSGALLQEGVFPVLLRPLHTHGGHGLVKIDTMTDLAAYLRTVDDDAFYLSQFVDYRGTDGWFRKYRVAFVGGAPFLCHMAASEHWMVHYLNAGMAESAAKRAAEAEAMAEFDAGFATRHAGAFAALCGIVGLDYFSIDCSQAPDGRLLVFEADVAAIIHSMDDPATYPYKGPAMQRCYDGFASMLRARSGLAG